MGRREMGREMNWGDAENERIKNCIRLRKEKQESTRRRRRRKDKTVKGKSLKRLESRAVLDRPITHDSPPARFQAVSPLSPR